MLDQPITFIGICSAMSVIGGFLAVLLLRGLHRPDSCIALATAAATLARQTRGNDQLAARVERLANDVLTEEVQDKAW